MIATINSVNIIVDLTDESRHLCIGDRVSHQMLGYCGLVCSHQLDAGVDWRILVSCCQ